MVKTITLRFDNDLWEKMWNEKEKLEMAWETYFKYLFNLTQNEKVELK